MYIIFWFIVWLIRGIPFFEFTWNNSWFISLAIVFTMEFLGTIRVLSNNLNDK